MCCTVGDHHKERRESGENGLVSCAKIKEPSNSENATELSALAQSMHLLYSQIQFDFNDERQKLDHRTLKMQRSYQL